MAKLSYILSRKFALKLGTTKTKTSAIFCAYFQYKLSTGYNMPATDEIFWALSICELILLILCILNNSQAICEYIIKLSTSNRYKSGDYTLATTTTTTTTSSILLILLRHLPPLGKDSCDVQFARLWINVWMINHRPKYNRLSYAQIQHQLLVPKIRAT